MVEFKVINIEDRKNRLVVTIKIADEIRSFGFPLSYADNHALSDKPQWMHKVKEILDRQYDAAYVSKNIKNKSKFIKKKFNTENIADLSNRGLLIKRRLKEQKEGDLVAEKRPGYVDPVPKSR